MDKKTYVSTKELIEKIFYLQENLEHYKFELEGRCRFIIEKWNEIFGIIDYNAVKQPKLKISVPSACCIEFYWEISVKNKRIKYSLHKLEMEKYSGKTQRFDSHYDEYWDDYRIDTFFLYRRELDDPVRTIEKWLAEKEKIVEQKEIAELGRIEKENFRNDLNEIELYRKLKAKYE